MDFTSLFNMQGMMFCILALGWYLRKSGMIDKSGKALLSSLVMNVTLPASIVKSFQMEFSMDILKLTLEVIVISFLIQIFSNLLSRVLYPGWSEESKKVLQYATIVSNAGILGNAIAEGIFGDLGIMYAAVYTIPTRIFMWSVGLTYFTEVLISMQELKPINCLCVSICRIFVLSLTFAIAISRFINSIKFVPSVFSHNIPCMVRLFRSPQHLI